MHPRQTTFGYENITGNLKWKEPGLDGGTSPRVEILGYEYGNPTEVKDARDNTTTTEYDALSHTYPVKVTYPPTTDNPSGTQQGHSVETGGYDYRFGSPGWSMDENGNFTYYTYDTFGRTIQVDYPDGGQTKAIFDDTAFPRSVQTKVKVNGAGQTMSKYKYFDGLGRGVQTKSFGEGGQAIVATVTYDAMGRVAQSDGPYFPTATNKAPADHPWVQTTYDDRGRPLTLAIPDGSGGTAIASFSYSGLTTTVIDPDGKKKTETKDALGRLLQRARPSPLSMTN